MNKTNLYNIDRQGHLMFSRRPELVKNYNKSDSGWEHPFASVAIMIICGILDFVMFQQLFSSFLYDSKAVLTLAIIAMLVGFDIAPIYLGIILKKRQQKINSSIPAAAGMGMAFLIAFAANIALRIAVKDLVLPDLSSFTTSAFGEVSETNTSSNIALLYALFASAMPVITSLVSFGVSFHSSSPLKARMQKLQREQIAIEDDIVKLEALLMEYEADSEHFLRLLEEDEQKYQNTLEMLHEKTVFYCDYVRERIKEHLKDPTSTNELSKDNRESLLQMLGTYNQKYTPSQEQSAT